MGIIASEHILPLIIIGILSFGISFLIVLIDALKRRKMYNEYLRNVSQTESELMPEVEQNYNAYTDYGNQYNPYGSYEPYAQDSYSQQYGYAEQGQQSYPSYGSYPQQDPYAYQEPAPEITCPNCGAKLPGNTSVCPFCNVVIQNQDGW